MNTENLDIADFWGNYAIERLPTRIVVRATGQEILLSDEESRVLSLRLAIQSANRQLSARGSHGGLTGDDLADGIYVAHVYDSYYPGVAVIDVRQGTPIALYVDARARASSHIIIGDIVPADAVVELLRVSPADAPRIRAKAEELVAMYRDEVEYRRKSIRYRGAWSA